jgi:hypothetical protein
MEDPLKVIIEHLTEDQLRTVVIRLAEKVPSMVNTQIARVMQVALPPTSAYEKTDNGPLQD